MAALAVLLANFASVACGAAFVAKHRIEVQIRNHYFGPLQERTIAVRQGETAEAAIESFSAQLRHDNISQALPPIRAHFLLRRLQNMVCLLVCLFYLITLLNARCLASTVR